MQMKLLLINFYFYFDNYCTTCKLNLYMILLIFNCVNKYNQFNTVVGIKAVLNRDYFISEITFVAATNQF